MTAPNLPLVHEAKALACECDLVDLTKSWKRALEGRATAKDLSPNTVKLYIGTAVQLHEFLAASKRLTTTAAITTEDLAAYLLHVRARASRSTEATRYAHLVQMFRWLLKEEEIATNPMADIEKPRPEERPVPIIPLADIQALLATCKGPDFVDKRDTAIIRLLLDGGVRRSELANLTLDLLDLDMKRFYVYGKKRRERWVPIGRNALTALDRYLRARRHHKHATDTDFVWLGRWGRLTGSGMAQMLEDRCAMAGIERLRPHQFRHTFCHQWMLQGGDVLELSKVTGWASTQMAARYGASAATERAHLAHRRLSPGDLV